MQRPQFLFGALVAAGLLYALSRTQRGSEFVDELVGDVIVTANNVRDASWPRGWRNNNPGNLRFIGRNAWRGQVGDDGGGYGVYATVEEGVRASGQQLLAYARAGRNTVRKIISTWAPSNENDTEAYVKRVAAELRITPDQVFDVNARLEALADSIFMHENANQYPYARADVHKWLRWP